MEEVTTCRSNWGMKDFFEILGVPAQLVIEADRLSEAFREAGKQAHPDAGGGDEEFARLREAFEIISSPSKRLKYWLDLRGASAEIRGAVDSNLMDLFSNVSGAIQQAESLIRRRDETKTALGLALLERETHICREAVEKALVLVDQAIVSECAGFPAMQQASVVDAEAASKAARNLAFLEKWRVGLRGVFGRLV